MTSWQTPQRLLEFRLSRLCIGESCPVPAGLHATTITRTGPARFEVERGGAIYVIVVEKNLTRALEEVKAFCDGKPVAVRAVRPLYVQLPLFEG